MRMAADNHVIARKGEALTWQSPGTMFRSTMQYNRLQQEIAPQAFPSVPRRFAPRNDKSGGALRYTFLFARKAETAVLLDGGCDHFVVSGTMLFRNSRGEMPKVCRKAR